MTMMMGYMHTNTDANCPLLSKRRIRIPDTTHNIHTRWRKSVPTRHRMCLCSRSRPLRLLLACLLCEYVWRHRCGHWLFWMPVLLRRLFSTTRQNPHRNDDDEQTHHHHPRRRRHCRLNSLTILFSTFFFNVLSVGLVCWLGAASRPRRRAPCLRQFRMLRAAKVECWLHCFVVCVTA